MVRMLKNGLSCEKKIGLPHLSPCQFNSNSMCWEFLAGPILITTNEGFVKTLEFLVLGAWQSQREYIALR